MTLSKAEQIAQELEEVMKECMEKGHITYKAGDWSKTLNGKRLQNAINTLKTHELVPKQRLRGGSPDGSGREIVLPTKTGPVRIRIPDTDHKLEELRDEGGYM